MRFKALLALPMLAACMGGSSPVVLSEEPDFTGGPGGPVELPDPSEAGLGHAGFALILNDMRTGNGVTVLAENALLTSASQAHAQDMETFGYVSHEDRAGGFARDRADAVGYDWDYIAENIAQGFDDNQEVIDAWMASPGHRDNLVDPRAEEFGLGRVDDTWVLMMGSRFPETPPPVGELEIEETIDVAVGENAPLQRRSGD